MSKHTPINQSFETPLAVAIAAGASKEVQRLLNDGAASSIFVKGSTSNSIMCTMPNAVKPESAVVTHAPPLLSVSAEIIELVDDGLTQFINTRSLHTNDIETNATEEMDPIHGPVVDSSNKKAERFRVGDIVKLNLDCSFSSLVAKEVCTMENSEVRSLNNNQ
jgi:hypothetical protein